MPKRKFKPCPDLKPCPFCGGSAQINVHSVDGYDTAFVGSCKNPKCNGWSYADFFLHAHTRYDAAVAWNRRAGEETK